MLKPKAKNFEIGQKIHVVVRKNSIELHGVVTGKSERDLTIMVDNADHSTSFPFATMDSLVDNTIWIKGSYNNVPLVGVQEAAQILGWDKRKVATYMKRGSFPEPIQRLAGGSIWTKQQILDYKKSTVKD